MSPFFVSTELFGERNEKVFPNTENGDALYRMATSGDCLWMSRKVNFSLVFSSKDRATDFADKAAIDNYLCIV
jgi:hypothetical protein